MGNEADIHECAQAECRAKKGDRFGFCHFSFLENSLDLKLVDLTVVNNISYDDLRLDSFFEGYTKKQLHDGKKFVNMRVEIKEIITKWGSYLYTKLLSEQIFKPLSDKDDKELMYTPFQTMSQYYISLGYSGIIYGSTVSNLGRNIVLFDKNVAHPIGIIEDYVLK
ncbi:RES family NAD+ phosphorylase [Ligilactobacillus agilis]|nr:RES family NAD+ phosphorylase [Ligilactobacillus agilis]